MKWSTFNQSLVRHCKILKGFDIINNGESDLKEMNKEKIGKPFNYPNNFPLLLLGYDKADCDHPYRQTEKGIGQEDMPMGKYLPFLNIP